MNKQGKRDIVHLLLILFFLVEIINVTNYFLNTSITINLYAKADNPSAVASPDAPQSVQEVKAYESPIQSGEEDPVKAEVDKVFKEYAPSAYQVIDCESDWKPGAKNPRSSAKGLLQIIDGTWKEMKCTGDPYNYQDNLACARVLFDDENQKWNTDHGWSASFFCHQQP